MNKGLLARKKVLRNKIVDHHINYEYNGLTHKQDAVIVKIYHNEHWLVGHLQKRGKYVSKGFLQTLKHFILIHEITGNFVELKKETTGAFVDLQSNDTDTIKNVGTEPCDFEHTSGCLPTR